MEKTKSIFLSDITLTTSTTHLILYILFFCSGCAALIYQVMWQRMLFTVFGVDLESITIIVSVFMFGLGVGGILGGYLADALPKRRLALYVILELGIAIFGFFSFDLINALSNTLFNSSRLITACMSFLVLAFPTILMGATFPILVTHVNQLHHNVGRSVGSLYFANTLGGAMGAYLSGFILLYSLDMVEVVNRAAFLNLTIAFAAILIFRRQK